jgi:hypothetical protein
MADPITVPSPSPGAETSIVHADIRHFIWDRTIEDNPLELDLEFSDLEIGHARRFAAMMWNSIPPYVRTITAEQVPTSEYGFLLAIVSHLFLAKLMSLQRKQIDYNAGGMSVDLFGKRIEYLTKWSVALKQEATEIIKTQKLSENLESGYACF